MSKSVSRRSTWRVAVVPCIMLFALSGCVAIPAVQFAQTLNPAGMTRVARMLGGTLDRAVDDQQTPAVVVNNQR